MKREFEDRFGRILFNKEELEKIRSQWIKELDAIEPGQVNVIIEMVTEDGGYVAFEPKEIDGKKDFGNLMQILSEHNNCYKEPIGKRIE